VKVSAEFKECLLGLLAYNEHERTSLAELNANPWLNNFTGEHYDTYMMEFKKKKAKLQEVISQE